MQAQSKYQLYNGIMMSGIMSLTLAGFFTWLNMGISSEWLSAWFAGVAIGWPLAFAVASLVGKPIGKLAAKLAG